MRSLNYGQRDIYQEVVHFVAVGGGVQYIEAPRVKNNQVLFATYVGVENQTTNYTTLIIGLKDGETFHKRQQEDSPSADIVYWTQRDIIVREGQRIAAQMTGLTGADICVMEIQGYLIDRDCREG